MVLDPSGIFRRFFETEVDETEDRLERISKAEEVLAFTSHAHFGRFMAWLENEAMRPVNTNEAKDMLVSAVRQNTFLEVRNHLIGERKSAAEALKRQHG